MCENGRERESERALRERERERALRERGGLRTVPSLPGDNKVLREKESVCVFERESERESECVCERERERRASRRASAPGRQQGLERECV